MQMGIMSSIYNSDFNIEQLFLGSEEITEMYLGDQLVFSKITNNLFYKLHEFVGSLTVRNTVEAPVKSAILYGSTKYKDVDTDEILETFEEGRNLELVSVKTPVLTTVGKNLFTPKYKNPDNYINHGVYYSMPIDLIEGKRYRMSFNVDGDITGCYFTLSSNPQPTEDGAKYTHVISNGTINNSSYGASKTNYICFYKGGYDMFSALSNFLLSLNNVQLEEGSVTTPYEPYKSNILTVNEDVTLRSNGNVYDELNLLTGRLTQRIDENNEVLAQEVVKTVDLTGSTPQSYNEVTHIDCSSTNGVYPLVKVEAASSVE